MGLMPAARFVALFSILLPAFGLAHHNPVVYDGKRTVTVSGTVTYARFGFPHSRYRIDVTTDAGDTETWTLMTEDPRDARMLGFDDELKAIRVGDPITVVGWPNKVKAREIRGHQLHYADGTVVMMRRGNYIWTNDLRRIWRLRDGQVEFPGDMQETADDASNAERVAAWITENRPVDRVAREIVDDSAGLIGLEAGDGLRFPGVDETLRCHTERADFRIEVDTRGVPRRVARVLAAGSDYVARYNDLMSKYWEYDIGNCP